MEHHSNFLLTPVEEIKIEVDSSCSDWVAESETETFSQGKSSNINQWNEEILTKDIINRHMITVNIQHLDVDTEEFEVDNATFQSINDPLLDVRTWSTNNALNKKNFKDKVAFNKRKLPRGTYICDYCNKKFIMRTSLVRHIKIHTGLGVYRCDVCGDIFPTYCKLESHNMVVHTGERPFVCEVCNAGFTQKYSLEDHKIIHSGERPFKCNICNKTFLRQRNLSSHTKLHSSIKEYECNVCMKKFSVKSNMTKHRLRHDNLVPKPFSCDLCSKSYEQRGHLEEHLRYHTGEKPFRCDLCGKRFARISSMNLHTRHHHTEVVSIECSFCDRWFNHERALKMHMMTHRDEKPYMCSVCKKGFVRRGDRNRHVTTHKMPLNSKVKNESHFSK